MIRKKDGIRIEAGSNVTVDPRDPSGDLDVISHAHSDHAPKKSSEAVCTNLTARLCEERYGIELEHSPTADKVELIPSGHILGSSSVLVKGEKDVLYTGDVCTEDRVYLEGFDPVDADILVIETTYGVPKYTFPDPGEVRERIESWVQDNDGSLFLFAYALGKAQKVQRIVEEVTDRPVLVHGSVEKMNDTIQECTDLEFNGLSYTENKEKLEEGAVYIGPTRTSRTDTINRLVKESDGKKAGFSGWAVDDSYIHRNSYDKAFPLSDHCDFNGLVSLVREVDPEKVYTYHGFDAAFASYLKRELGYNARSLEKNQSSLNEF